MDIKNKINDVRINEFPISFMPTLVRSINKAIAQGMNRNMRLIWSEDLEYEIVEYGGSIYKDKASEYGKNSLYVLIRVDETERDNPDAYSVLAVWQNKKFLGRSGTDYKTITAILNNDFYRAVHRPTWLIIKNPKIEDYSYREDDNRSPQQQKDIDINNAYKKYSPLIKDYIKKIKKLTQDTPLKNDNPLEIAKNIIDKMFANPDKKWDIQDQEVATYVSGLNSKYYRIKNMYNNLINIYISFLTIIDPGNPLNKLKIDEERKEISKKIKANKDFPEKPNRIEIIDKSGYAINLSKWLEKKWDKFKNSNNLLESLAYEMQSEYNDLVFETKVTIKELINSDDREDWMSVERFSNFIVIYKNQLDIINKDISQFINSYTQNNEPLDTNSYEYRRIIKSIKEFITAVKKQKEIVF